VLHNGTIGVICGTGGFTAVIANVSVLVHGSILGVIITVYITVEFVPTAIVGAITAFEKVPIDPFIHVVGDHEYV
jgi:hypothetical protein